MSDCIFIPLIYCHNQFQSPTHHDTHRPLVQHFDALSHWTTHTIDASEGGEAWIRFAALMDEMHRLNNFNGMAAVWVGINNSCVGQNKKLLNQNNPMIKICKKASEMFSSKFNYDQYRKEMKSAGVPCVPFVRVLVSDITELIEGTEPIFRWNFVDFERCRRIAEIVLCVCEVQIRYSNVMEITVLQDWIKENIKVTDLDLKRTSKKIITGSDGSKIELGSTVVGFLSFVEFPNMEMPLNERRDVSQLSPLNQRVTFDDMVWCGDV